MTLADEIRDAFAGVNQSGQAAEALIAEVEAAKALRIHGKMAEWLESGIDESAAPLLVREAAALINSFRSGPESPAAVGPP